MYCVHRNLKVIHGVVFVGGNVAANVITLENLVFIEWEGVLECDILNVGGLERLFFRRPFEVIRVSDKLVKDWYLLKGLHVYVEHMLDLSEGLFFISFSLLVFV